ncbi:choline transporter-like protein 4 [Dendronephthya gigantea]|uniref:choline transporter-like protein 4 n=1 Tax=Dendronephthya gigantea TaxID=151771 RepID=UPI00106A7578|nr:choline transporter-like protein 4 [Dendronephthya gigantea]
MGCCGNKTDTTNDIEMRDTDQKSGGNYGKSKKFDPQFNGPIKDRSCTDIPCCILFVLFLVGMAIVGILAFLWGNPDRLIHPVNSEGKICGTGDYKDKPKLLYFDLTECVPTDLSKAASAFSGLNHVCPTTKVCVTKCPTKNSLGTELSCKDMACKPGIEPCDATVDEIKKYVEDGKCAPYYLESEDILHRCIPTVFGSTAKGILDSDKKALKNSKGLNVTTEELKEGSKIVQALIDLQNVGLKVLEDVRNSWWLILAGFGIAMVASFLYIVTMRWIAGMMVWLTTYAVLTLLGFGVYYCYTKYKELDDAGESSDFVFTANLSVYKDSKKTWLAFTIILGVFLLILILLLLALRKRIQIAVALIKEGSRAISSMLFTLLWPIIPWLLQLIAFAWFVAVGVYLVTTGDAEFQLKNTTDVIDPLCKYQDYVDSENQTCLFVKFSDEVTVFRLQVYHLFGWFWIMNFVIALGQCVLAGSFASYYWAWDKKTDIPAFPVMASFMRTLRYHTGSLAFGSLIIAIVQIIRATLEYIEHKLKESGQDNQIVKYILKCLKCCFWCLEKFLKFLNKNAYIEIAIYGKNFCVSAKNAFFLLMRNVVRVVVLDKVTDFLLFIGKLTITLGMAVGSFYWFERDKNLNYYLAPVIIITVATYVIATAFFSVYEMAIDTLFLCFLEDLERNDGSEEKPYYMSKKLKKILGKKNKRNSDSE